MDSWRYAADRPNGACSGSAGGARMVAAAYAAAAAFSATAGQQPVLALAQRYQGPDPELAEALERWEGLLSVHA